MRLEMVFVGPSTDPLSLQVLETGCGLFMIWMLVGEVKGDGLRYSKFAKAAGLTWPSRLGMAVMYLPSFLLPFAFLLLKLSLPPSSSTTTTRLLLTASALSLHFGKRLLEVLFIHKYSGSMEAKMSILVSGAYAAATGLILFAQQVAAEKGKSPPIDLMKWGIGLFVVGITGNFYHHYLLSTLRSDKKPSNGKSQYKIPEGGLFRWVVCPHYLFESIGFLGIALIAQTFCAVIVAVGMSASLCARSYKTKDWYLKKIDGFPADRKPFFPFLF
ncbi:hypothetical protein L7F22_017717 [Adiantum nelumboides]|nr:hypothetical protein [Adiantum nelumboides]